MYRYKHKESGRFCDVHWPLDRHTRYKSKCYCQYDSCVTRISAHITYCSLDSTLISIVADVVYGIQVRDMNADYVVNARTALEGFVRSGEPGAFWVEFFPFLRFIPSWVPGATFKRFVEHYRPFVQRTFRGPFQIVKDSLVSVRHPYQTGLLMHHKQELENSPPCATKELLYRINNKDAGPESYTQQEQMVMESMGTVIAGMRLSFTIEHSLKRMLPSCNGYSS